ncbi:MAG: metalloregulator ArsR/SmtB family transcription factor [Nitrospirales bacterium]|nr:metalloregulator ArsR/SmtB family transcription factor [Nitrospirales bacterium]
MHDLVTIFKALSDETRLRIIRLLHQGELCVCDLVAALDMVQPKVSFHLKILREANLIRDRKEGRWIHYRLDDSDLFIRFLLLSSVERSTGAIVEEDQKRLDGFRKAKTLLHPGGIGEGWRGLEGGITTEAMTEEKGGAKR